MSRLLTAIVPITQMYGRLHFVRDWLETIDPNVIEVVLIHDIQDANTSRELTSMVTNFAEKKIRLIEGYFGSPGLARNAGIEIAKSEWIVFWDSDDTPDVDAFIEMVTKAKKAGAEIAIGGYQIVNFGESQKNPSATILPALGDWGSNIPINPGIWRWAFRSHLFRNLRFESFGMGEDQALLICIEPLLRNLFIFERCVYHYSINQESRLTSNKNRINEISKSIRFITHRLRFQKKNYFEATVLLRQCVTAIKKAKFSAKVLGLAVLLSTFVELAMLNTKTLIKSIRSIYLFAFRKKYEPYKFEVLMLGGLGNQLFQLAAGLRLAGTENLHINYGAHQKKINGFTDLQEFVLPANVLIDEKHSFTFIQRKLINFGIRLSSSNESLALNRATVVALVKCLQLLLGISSPGKWKINNGVGFDEMFEKNAANYNIGYFQTYKYLQLPDVRKVIDGITLREPSEVFLSSQKELIKFNSVVVHVRLGDYRTESKFGIPSVRYFHESIIELWRTGEYARICLFTNEINDALKYVPLFLHEKTWIPNKSLVSTSETLELMRHGKGFVLSNSSFGWWAAQLSHHDSPVVICPSPWFAKKNEPNALIPEEWIRNARLE